MSFAVAALLLLAPAQPPELPPDAFQLLRPPPAAPAPAPAWPADYESARKAGKPLLLKFSMPGCVPCRQMEAQTLPDPAVAAALEQFSPVEGDAAAFGVDRFPTYAVVAPSGAELGRLVGFAGPADFARFLAAARAKPDRTPNYDEAVAQVRARRLKGAVVCKACPDDLVARRRAEAEAEGLAFCVAPAADARFQDGTTRYALASPGDVSRATATHTPLTPPPPPQAPPQAFRAPPPQFFMPPPMFFRGGGGGGGGRGGSC
jgi:hypothetical protein